MPIRRYGVHVSGVSGEKKLQRELEAELRAEKEKGALIIVSATSPIHHR